MENWIGHVCAPWSPKQDSNLLLSLQNWQEYFETVVVDLPTWDSLEQIGFWDQISERFGIIIDRYEEEWLDAALVEEFALVISDFMSRLNESEKLDRQDTDMRHFLVSLSNLAQAAVTRSVPVIFCF